MENEMRNKMTEQKKVFDTKLDVLNKRVQTQQVQIAQLSKTGKRTTNAKESVKEREKDNNNSSPNNSDSPNTN
jgi:hypothetical protein